MRLLAFSGLICAAAWGGSVVAQEAPVAPAAATSAAAVSTDFVAGEGRVQVAEACAACHPASIVTAKRFSDEKWAEVVDQMISKGARVTDADYDVIVGYLARNYGEGKAG